MARVKGILENFQGKLDNSLSIRIRPNGASTYPAHIRQHVVTRCIYYERYTTEGAIQAAAKSYGGFTDKDIFLKP